MQKSNHYFFIDAVNKRIQEKDNEILSFQEEFYRMEAGSVGEKKLKLVLDDYPFKNEYSIFYNFECMNDRGFSHQIDALLITPFFILILEVKQITGTLCYKPALHEFYRITENKLRDNFPNPFDQTFRHKLFLEQFLLQFNIVIPIHELVVIANYRAQLDDSLKGLPIIHLSGLPRYLENLFATYISPLVNISMIHKKLQQIHQPLPARRSIEAHRLKHGVLCKKCNYCYKMHYARGNWICEKCNSNDRSALFEALHHYRVLIRPTISNKEFRDFVGIDSKFTASKILTRLDLEKHGDKKGRYYVIPEDIFYKE